MVLARSEDDVAKSIQFARNHMMAISVFGTGHEFNDRNAGEGTNSLLIRTMCLRNAEINLDYSEEFEHADGVIRLGSGMTWGTSKMGDIGVHELAAGVDRVVVSGHAGNVGIVGWSLGGGHGQLVGTYGMGVDQVLQVEMLVADGTFIIANERGTTKVYSNHSRSHSTENELFWALRGGGAGTWGIITSMTVKLHRTRNSCVEGCYTQWTSFWEGNLLTDGPQLLEEIIHEYLKWTGTASKHWSSYAAVYPKDDSTFGFAVFEALYVGVENDEGVGDYWGFNDAFESLYPDKRVAYDMVTFDRFLDKLQAQDPESVNPQWEVEPMVTVLMNQTSVSDLAAAKMVVDNWFPRCATTGGLCVASYLFMHTVSTGEEDDFYTGTAVSPSFRQAKMHLGATTYTSFTEDTPIEDKVRFAHDVIGPEFYRYILLKIFAVIKFHLS